MSPSPSIASVASETEKRTRRATDPRLIWFAIGCSTFAVVASLVAMVRGPGLNADSVNYYSTGLNLAAGRGLRTFDGTTLTMFPPGLPGLIAGGHLVGLDPDWTVRLINSASYGVTVWFGFVLLWRHVVSTRLVVAMTILIAVSVTLLARADNALTEGIFIAISLAFVLLLEQLSFAPSRAPWLIAASAMVWLGFLDRYAGIALIPAGVLTILWIGRRRGWMRNLVEAGAFGVLSLVVPLLVMAHNHSVNGTLMGSRAPSPDGPVVTAERFVATLGRWIAPDPSPRAIQAAAGVALVLFAVGLVVWVVIDSRRGQEVLWPTATTSVAPMVVFSGVYAGYLVTAQLTTAFDPIGTRLMAPLYVPMVVLATMVLERLWSLLDADRRASLRPAATAVLSLFLVVQAVAFGRELHTAASDGIGYAAPAWRSSGVIEAARSAPASADLYSNVPAGVWAVLRREPIRRSPAKRARRAHIDIPMSHEFLHAVACRKSYLLWSEVGGGDNLFTPEELARYVRLDAVRKTSDSTLYRLTPRDGAARPTC
jgi:hypothetical protein